MKLALPSAGAVTDNTFASPSARLRLAHSIFVLSLAAFLVNILYSYVLSNGGAVMGKQMAITIIVDMILLAFFAWCSWFRKARHVLG